MRYERQASVESITINIPPLDERLSSWIASIKQWRKEFQQIIPFTKHIGGSDSEAADMFHKEVEGLIADL
jgi:hypothetical protein